MHNIKRVSRLIFERCDVCKSVTVRSIKHDLSIHLKNLKTLASSWHKVSAFVPIRLRRPLLLPPLVAYFLSQCKRFSPSNKVSTSNPTLIYPSQVRYDLRRRRTSARLVLPRYVSSPPLLSSPSPSPLVRELKHAAQS